MFIYKGIKYSTEEDFNALMTSLKDTDLMSLSDSDMHELKYIMFETPYHGLRANIALLLADTQKDWVLPYLIFTLKKYIHTNYTATLTYSCSYFDCHNYIEVFVDAIILKKDSSVGDAYFVIEKIKQPILKEVKMYCINKLKAYMDQVEENSGRYEDINDAINLIEKIPVQYSE